MLQLNKNYLDVLRDTAPIHITDPSTGTSMDIAPLNTIILFNDYKHSRDNYKPPNKIYENYEPKEKKLTLKTGYLEHLSAAKPTRIGSAQGGLSAIGGHTIQSLTIPSLNTMVSFDEIPTWNPKRNKGLSAMSNTLVPENFTWRYDKQKGQLISKPGNQMLCGSCWAISAAGIIGDNFVVSNLVDYVPNISTTWILVNYPQLQCGGGNPALAFQQIVNASVTNGGVVSNHCLDYSWCATNDVCNGDAKKHMDHALSPTELNDLIPKNAGCYNSNVDHLLFTLQDPVNTLAIGMTNTTTNSIITEEDWKTLSMDIKKHILLQGPVLGGFLVFKNFMTGVWTKTEENKGIYLENGVYDSATLRFDENQTSGDNFKGSHAIAIIGWGIEKDVTIDNNGTKAEVPYWYCRNSWTENWGDGGYFKMAMYPYNQLAQFDKQVTLNSSSGGRPSVAGGIVLIKATKKPSLVKFDAIALNPDKQLHTLEDEKYYSIESMGDEKPEYIPPPAPPPPPTAPPAPPPKKSKATNNESSSRGSSKSYGVIIAVLLIGTLITGLFVFLKRRKLK